MAEPPELDGRRAEAIRADIGDLAPYYAPDWDPDAGGVGAGLVDVFAELGAEVTERLDAAPGKHEVAFFDTLGFAARPPQAARVPVQFTLAPEAPRNVAVRPGTAAIAAADEEVEFRVGSEAAFETTPARLTDVIAVAPEYDAIYDHGSLIDGSEAATPWLGEDQQAHEWFIGDADLLSAGADDQIVVDLDSDVDRGVLLHQAEWDYYGKETEDGDPDWYPLHVLGTAGPGRREGDLGIILAPEGPLVEYAVDGVESKWLRCRLPPGTPPTGAASFEVRAVGLTTGSSGSGRPDTLLANDVPQKNPGSDEEPIRPFGDQPRRGDAFYIASSSAFSKAGADVDLVFTPLPSESTDAATDGGQVAVRARGGNKGDDQDVEATVNMRQGKQTYKAKRAKQQAILQTEGTQTKKATATVTKQETGDDSGDGPSLSWEYWDGGGWARLEGVSDGTGAFTATKRKKVNFLVPHDLEPTTVSGHENHWIRVRIVGGDYGDTIYVSDNQDDTRWARQSTGSPPAFTEIELSYSLADRRFPSHVRTHNAMGASDHDPQATMRPFEPLAEDEQTLYLGFDKPLSGGPLQLFAGVDEHLYPTGFAPQLEWERRHAHDAGWIRPAVQDDTASLTEEGILGLAFADATRPTTRFGRERHWVRARVTGDRFDPFADVGRVVSLLRSADLDLADLGLPPGSPRYEALAQRVTEATADSNTPVQVTDGGSETLAPCGESVETDPPGGAPTTAPPEMTGLHMNTGWAHNVQTVEDELLGGSDGEREQTFAVGSPPAVDTEVWVDELTALSAPQREDLLAERPDDVEVERTTDGDARAFWVRWEGVPDLLDSGSDARHYTVDAIDGEIRFGDGTNGRIPPRGTNNVRASYRTGGGASGNVPAGAVAELKSGLPFVDDVTNPAPGAGGADTESTAAVLERAPQTLKDRGRAVMPADYERLAADAFRRVARAKCIPGMDPAGDYETGFVTVLVVPSASGETPVPSLGLLDRVESALGEQAPVGVVESDHLIVRGPSYVSVGVEADVVAGDVGSLGAVEERCREAVEAFLHPLSGRDGEGWDFGALPTRSDVFALLEGVEGVDHVESLFLTYVGADRMTVGEGEPQPEVSADALVRGGSHDLTVALGGSD